MLLLALKSSFKTVEFLARTLALTFYFSCNYRQNALPSLSIHANMQSSIFYGEPEQRLLAKNCFCCMYCICCLRGTCCFFASKLALLTVSQPLIFMTYAAGKLERIDAFTHSMHSGHALHLNVSCSLFEITCKRLRQAFCKRQDFRFKSDLLPSCKAGCRLI